MKIISQKCKDKIGKNNRTLKREFHSCSDLKTHPNHLNQMRDSLHNTRLKKKKKKKKTSENCKGKKIGSDVIRMNYGFFVVK